MKIWIETATVEPPHDKTISGRFGASVMFVYYSRVLESWFWLQPGGIQEKIAEPQAIFIDQEWAEAHRRSVPKRREKPTKIHRPREEQLFLI